MKYTILAAAVWITTACTQPKPTPEAKATPEYFHVDPATAASVHGTIRFTGKRPVSKTISMNSEPACESSHKGPVVWESVETGPGGTLANVFVYVKSGLEGKVFPPAQNAVVLDQRGCMFVPRVVAVRAGQTLTIKNSDPVSHNVHPNPKNNRDWNQQQSPGDPALERRFARPEVMIPVKCNIHSWMKTWIGVLDHPYFAVTDRSGAYTFDNLPPGDYTLAAWHEHFGERIQTIHIGPKATATSNFTMHD